MSPPEIHAHRVEPAFPCESIPKMWHLLAYRVEKWGYDNYPRTWPNEPVMPLLTHVQEIDLMTMTIRGVLPWRKCTQEQNTNGDSQEIIRGQKWEGVLSFGRKQKRADYLAGEDEAMESATVSKRARGDSSIPHSQIGIHFPSVLVYHIGGGPPQLRWFSLFIRCALFILFIDFDIYAAVFSRRKITKQLVAGINEFSCAKENPAEILEMFGSYNILLFGKETSLMSWSLDTLRDIGPLDVLRKVQDHRSHSMTAIAVHMSLNTFSDDPLHIIFASHVSASEGTVDLLLEEGFNPQYPCGAISFWTVSMKGAIRYIHSNGAGVGTVVEAVCGRQLCCVHPDMHYAVVTLENTIVKGHRFYTTSALQKSVSGWVHTSMLGYTITDDLHLEFQKVLLHMMCYFSAIILCDGRVELENHDVHVPSISTRDGLLNLIALGNLCVFSSALNHRVHDCGSNEKGKLAIAAAVVAYSSIIEYANKWYRLVFLQTGVEDIEKADRLGDIHMRTVSIADFAHCSAAHFAKSLITYTPRALEWRKALGQQEPMLFNFEAFEQDIKDAMMEFMDKDFTDEFIKVYESQRRKRMLFKPKFLVKENY
ncbi:hypothetical protein F5146DRAFT_1197893 [Armillaria mellea]|nr:hypothetical protein F5146DRAFT_1197893 [Armillaria mellea]